MGFVSSLLATWRNSTGVFWSRVCTKVVFNSSHNLLCYDAGPVELSFRFGRPRGTEAKEDNGGPARPRQAPIRPRKIENMEKPLSIARL